MPETGARGEAPWRGLLIDGTPEDEALLARLTGGALHVVTCSSATLDRETAADCDVAIIGRAAQPESVSPLLARLPERLRGGSRGPPAIVRIARGRSSAPSLSGERVSAAPADDTAAVAAALFGALARAGHHMRERARSAEHSLSGLRRSERLASFQVRLEDDTHGLDDPAAIAAAGISLLRACVDADRGVFGTLDPESAEVTYSSVASRPGVPSLAGRAPTAHFGSDFADAMVAGQPVVLYDIPSEIPAGGDADAYRALMADALIAAPVMQDGAPIAVVGVQMLEARDWLDEEVELVSVAADRLGKALELARVSRALRDSERDFRSLFELSAVGVAETDLRTGLFIRANRRFLELVGYTEEELQGVRFSDITHPDDRERNMELIASVMRGERDRWDIEKRYLHKDGRRVWVHVSGQMMAGSGPHGPRMIANALDVTDRRKAEEALRASRQQLRSVTSNAPVWLANCGRDYHYKFVNDAYAVQLGAPPEQIIGRHVRDVLGPAAFEQMRPHADRALAGQHVEFEAKVEYKGFGEQCIRCAYAPERDESGNVVGWIAAVLDITDRIRAEEALREADRRKNEFLAVLGHELRNPLAPLRAGLELLKHGEQRPKLLDGLCAMMDRQLNHLIRLVDDLLDLARITRGTVELKRAVIDLRDVVRTAVELCAPAMGEREHRLEVTLGDAPIVVVGDFERLTQVLGNLLSNASKYTPPHGHITIHAGIEDGRARVRVCDDGFGIPPERLEEMFDMFSQVPEHRTRTGGGGTGIGLALSRQLVALHDGTVHAFSGGLDCGSEFVVELPLARAGEHPEYDQPAGLSPPSPNGAPPASSWRVLVVDDNIDAAESLRLLLEFEGYVVETSHDGIAALQRFPEFQPHVVLLDIGLPAMDGYEVAHRLRTSEAGRRTKIFALTGWAQTEDKQRAAEAGFDAHMTKPVDPQALRRMIEDALAGG